MRNVLLIVFVTFIALLVVISICFKRFDNLDKKIEKINLQEVDNLLIVAHPDDETIWAGSHLIDDNYLVVCITSGRNIIRTYELKKAMKITNSQVISLGYPDKIKRKRDNWSTSYKYITSDLDKIIKLKKWKIIATHNSDGEYGHIHHQMTNKIVTDIYNKENIDSDLYFFGKYYTKRKISNKDDVTYEMKKQNLKIKNNEMIKVYKSQKFIRKMFNHMFRYEDWIKYEKEKGSINEENKKA